MDSQEFKKGGQMKKGFILVTLSCLLVTSLTCILFKRFLDNFFIYDKSGHYISDHHGSHNSNNFGSSDHNDVYATTVIVTTTSTGNWWDTLGTPQYGGTLTDYSPLDFGLWDPYNSSSLATCNSAFMEGLYGDDWALNPSVFDFSTGFRPTDYVNGLLAATWEFTNPGTYIVHLRQNVYWQNISPVNGRQFVANDVVYNFGRDFGHGDGFTTPSPALATNPLTTSLTSVTATDNFTVVFTFNTPNVEFILESMEAVGEDPLAAPEAVTQWGNLNDWHHAIGTGPFICRITLAEVQ